MERSLKEIAQLVKGKVVGDGTALLSGISSISSATQADLVFVEHNQRLQEALHSSAGAVILSRIPNERSTKPLLICAQPRLAFAQAAALLAPGDECRAAVHETALVHATATIGRDVTLGAYVTIGDNAAIGDGTRIGPGSHIGAGVKIGHSCELAPNVTVYAGVRIGARVKVKAGAVLGSDGFGFVKDNETGRYLKFPQVGLLEIGDDVEIGAHCTIDKGALDVTRIGRGTKIDNLVHVGHNVQVGEDVVIAAQTGLSGSAVLESGVIVGGQVGIADHVRVEAGAILGAQCGVPSKKVIRGKGVVFWGTPARPIREYLKELAVLARIAKKVS
jgi:UDP-3-O-[3-hydroxymyristoyl] glucosamine N-acyltransferase